jgi:hypothetical protein
MSAAEAEVARRLLGRSLLSTLTACVLAVALPTEPAAAHDPHAEAKEPAGEHGSLAEVGQKLSNPVSNVWAMFTEFDLTFNDGDVNEGGPEVGGSVIFQPILPFPLYGEGDDQWKLIVRPTVPLLLGQPVPKGFDDFNNLTGLADSVLPLLASPPPTLSGNWLLGFGPTFYFPTATQDAFAANQWGLGPAAVIGYKTKDWVGGVFPQWYFKVGSAGQGSEPALNQLSLLYFFFYNLPDAWQIGFNPTITYDRRASGGNAWNVPIGLVAAKTTKIGNQPVKFQFGMEYSVASQDEFGKRFLLKLNVIPVIPSLVKNPLLGR